LIENSLDAGSNQITVEISEGGRFIRVQDNGKGILSTDLDKALQRHATSKITKTDDLWNLHTFGFRGEALASAAAVSKMTLKSLNRMKRNLLRLKPHSVFYQKSSRARKVSGLRLKLKNYSTMFRRGSNF